MTLVRGRTLGNWSFGSSGFGEKPCFFPTYELLSCNVALATFEPPKKFVASAPWAKFRGASGRAAAAHRHHGRWRFLASEFGGLDERQCTALWYHC